ncbi:MAG TPA: hypothetical protein VF062_19340 [Candidatus Limnocylindrales bacterium]
MFTNAEMAQQLINDRRSELIAEADQYRLLAAARKALRARSRARSRTHNDLS